MHSSSRQLRSIKQGRDSLCTKRTNTGHTFPLENVYFLNEYKKYAPKIFSLEPCEIYGKVEYTHQLVFEDIAPLEYHEQSRDNEQQFGKG